MTVLVIAEHDNAALKPATLHAVTAALQCGGEVEVLVAGHQCDAVARAAARIVGVARVRVADAPQFADGLAENVAAQALALAAAVGHSHVLAPATAYGKNILPRVAARLDVAQVSDIIKVIAPDTFERPMYAGNVIATVRSTDAVKVLTVRTTAFEAAGVTSGEATIERVEPVAAHARAKVVSRQLVKSARPELTAASAIVSGGRGLGSADNFAILEPLADRLGAAMGASRAAVDAGFAPNDWQVGQTGKIVAPQLYVAVGISGAIQHLAGMKDSKVIVAINKDAEAPIFGVADFGIVGDLFEIVPQLTAALG
ncbi:electron transfer flavoprotein alpha subunit apoprotein [Paraburkholderia sp. BL6665CI2N2]|uniref:electron transfer flavoprotein subunit alpha/FixB family protein n=1 Tax=Paraburkholderia sp. BL6665CI2N2 TaxID=1938806 RepID=UPI001065B86A|nr:FAD-binding protein [Paraburkholderia sp. BL6665CI2N2]TDY16858.1 electron transfer flavoprotein alpha subunit apoprotein [Paraburkholderia sp. BL6665CI2N2]